MSPGARTIPAAMVLPTAADIPNHIPSTFSKPPRLRTAVLLGASEAVFIEGGWLVWSLERHAVDAFARRTSGWSLHYALMTVRMNSAIAESLPVCETSP